MVTLSQKEGKVSFFPRLYKVLLCVYHTVFIPSSAKEHLPCFRCLASLSWDRHYRWPLYMSISSWLDKYLVVEWVNQMVDLFAMLEGPSMSLSIVAALIYATTCNGVVPLLHECPALVTFSFLLAIFLMRWYLTVLVLICIPWTICLVEYFILVKLGFCYVPVGYKYLLLGNAFQKFDCHFLIWYYGLPCFRDFYKRLESWLDD